MNAEDFSDARRGLGDFALRVFKRQGDPRVLLKDYRFHDAAIKEARRLSAQHDCPIDIFVTRDSEVMLTFEARVTA